jgi:hypothetical protein
VSRSPGGVTTTTAANGSNAMAGVPVGTYSQTAEKPGYRSQTVAGQTVVEGATTTVEFALPALAPTIALSRTSLSASTTQGASPATQGFTVQNTGGAVLRYAISTDVPWLSVTLERDEHRRGGRGDGRFRRRESARGHHRALVSVSDPGADNSPQQST